MFYGGGAVGCDDRARAVPRQQQVVAAERRRDVGMR